MMRRLILAALLLAVLLLGAEAHRDYLKSFPNPDRIPCPDGVNCQGSRYCAGWGHPNCLNGKTNQLADDVGTEWSPGACLLDTDGDGLTNGDEMGDPCCVWNYGDAPDYTTPFVSHPGVAGSTHSRSSCKSGSAPTPPATVVVTPGSSTLTIAWTVADTSQCVCAFEIELSSATTNITYGHVQSNMRVNQNPFVACGLPPSTAFTVTMRARNLDGTSGGATAVGTTTAASSTVNDGLQCSTVFQAPAPLLTNTYEDDMIWHVIVALSGVMIVMVVLAVLYSMHNTKSKVRNMLLVKRVFSIPHEGGGRCASLCGPLRYTTGEQLIMGVVLVVASVAFFIYYWDWYGTEIYVWGGDGQFGRTLGQLCFLPAVVLLFPTTRHSVFLRWFGVSQDTAIKAHQFLGWLFISLVVLHGVAMTAAYDDSEWGSQFIFLPEGAEYPALPGTIAGVLYVALGVLSLNCVRRKYYTLFKSSHIILFLVALLLTIIHYPLFIAYIGLGLVLWIVDYLLMCRERHCMDTEVVGAHRFGAAYKELVPVYANEEKAEEEQKDEMDHEVVERSVYSKNKDTDDNKDAANAKDADADADAAPAEGYQYLKLVMRRKGFTFHPGQYVYLHAPSLSWVPHPFTICSPPNDPPNEFRKEGTFTIYIKNMGPGSFTDRLINHAEWKTSEEDDDTHQGAKTKAHSRLVNGFKLHMYGPCGAHAVKLEDYDDVLLIGGGIGITPMASLFNSLLNESQGRAAFGAAPKADPAAVQPTQVTAKADGASPGSMEIEMKETEAEAQSPEKLGLTGERLRVAKERRVTLVWSVRDTNLAHHVAEQLVGAQDTFEASGGVGDDGHTYINKLESGKAEQPNQAQSSPLPPNFALKLYCSSQTLKDQLAKAESKGAAASAAESSTEADTEAETDAGMTFGLGMAEVSLSTRRKARLLWSMSDEFRSLVRTMGASHDNIVVASGRPSVESVLKQAKESAKARGGSEKRTVAVAVCGPLGLIDAVQAQIDLLSDNDVEFHISTENFIF